jgi:hypothetical protein
VRCVGVGVRMSRRGAAEPASAFDSQYPSLSGTRSYSTTTKVTTSIYVNSRTTTLAVKPVPPVFQEKNGWWNMKRKVCLVFLSGEGSPSTHFILSSSVVSGVNHLGLCDSSRQISAYFQ